GCLRQSHSVSTGARGKEALRAFYRDDFIPSWPEDVQMTPVNVSSVWDSWSTSCTESSRTAGRCRGFYPTHKRIFVDFVVVVQFRGDKLACERIYWNHASV